MHWKAPTILVISFLIGLGFALGHHSFYAMLANRRTEDPGIHSQSTNIEIGTLCSHIVRASYALTISTAYWQLFWQTMRRRSIAIGTIDSLVGALSAAQSLCDWAAITAGPHLMTLALLTWLVPWAMIVPPGTLSVTLVKDTTQRNIQLRVPAFGDPDYCGAFVRSHVNKSVYGVLPELTEPIMLGRYKGVSRDLFQTAMGMAYSGEIPTIQPSLPNSTYTLDYLAPAVSCQEGSLSLLQEFENTTTSDGHGINASLGECVGSGCYVFQYVAWIPELNIEVPFLNGSIHDGVLPVDSTIGPAMDEPRSHSHTGTTGDPARFFVATRTHDDPAWNVLNCSLYNASYLANFNFSGEQQHTSVGRPSLLNHMPARTSTVYYYSPTDGIYWMYQSIMDLLGQLMVGAISQSVDRDDVEFGILVSMMSSGAEVIYTNVVASQELFQIAGPQPGGTQGLVNVTASGIPLSEAIQELAANMSLALFIREGFLKELDRPTSVTTENWENRYVYDSERLWAAYASATACTLLALLVAAFATVRHGTSYSNNFSTALRMTRGQDYDKIVGVNGRGGEDPLPGRIARAKVRLGEGSSANSSVHELLNTEQRSGAQDDY